MVIEMMLSELAHTLNTSVNGKDVMFKGCSIDSRQEMQQALFIALEGERFDGHDFICDVQGKGAAALLVNRSVDSDLPQVIVDNTKVAMGLLAQSWRKRFAVPVVGITGSNGKTTVKEMLTAILQQQADVLATKGNFNNDIGMPLTLFQLAEQHQYIVLEIGANHAGEIDHLSHLAEPDVAVITQCAPAHLEGFGSIEGVARAKAEIYNGLVVHGVAVINADDEFADYWCQQTAARNQLLFGVNKPADITATAIKPSVERIGFDFQLHYQQQSVAVSLNVAGRHNVMNALAAASCALALNIDLQTIADGLASFAGVNGRMQVKQARNSATIIDDTYNANPTSLAAAIEHLVQQGNDSYLVLGDMAELGSDSMSIHQQAGELAREQGVKNLFTIGSLSRYASDGFGRGAQHFSDKHDLIEQLMLSTTATSTILIKGSRSMKMEEIVLNLINEGATSC